jgi:hypothetical protein
MMLASSVFFWFRVLLEIALVLELLELLIAGWGLSPLPPQFFYLFLFTAV